MTLQRPIITFKHKEIVLSALYKTQDGPNPDTKARHREVTGLTRCGLTQALEALEGGGVRPQSTGVDGTRPQPKGAA